jgi:predicted 3-demethylubiquinone-9 3-methyltransferase (glyoxalase superfamily)
MTQYPCLWFDGNAKEAAEFYCSVFNKAKLSSVNPIVARFEVDGQYFMCLNGGPKFEKNPSISFYTVCETEEEVETLWNRLSEGGNALMALDSYPWSKKYGWISDKFGVSWQVTMGSIAEVGQKFTPMLMFSGPQAGKASEAIDHYTSIFHPSSVIIKVPYGEGQAPEGYIMHSRFLLDKNLFMAMDSFVEHKFNFNEGISLVVECESQVQIDHFWNKLTDGGEESMCGWLKDKYGVSWQIVPAVLGKLMSDPERSQRVMNAFMKMRKFDIEALQKA